MTSNKSSVQYLIAFIVLLIEHLLTFPCQSSGEQPTIFLPQLLSILKRYVCKRLGSVYISIKPISLNWLCHNFIVASVNLIPLPVFHFLSDARVGLKEPDFIAFVASINNLFDVQLMSLGSDFELGLKLGFRLGLILGFRLFFFNFKSFVLQG